MSEIWSHEQGLNRFYSGQRVVAVDAMPGSAFKNGQEYTVASYEYKENPANRPHCFWYIGIVGHHNGDCWFRPNIFAPLEETFISIEYHEVLEKEKTLIGAN